MRGRKKSWDTWEDRRLDYKDFRQDHGGGPEEIPHRPKRGRKNPRPKGCPATNGKAHIYVWVEHQTVKWHYNWRTNTKSKGTFYEWKKTCIGCEHVNDYRWWWRAPSEVYEVRHSDST